MPFRQLGQLWVRRLRQMGSGDWANVNYLLRDEFMVDRAAGSVNGTPAEPGPGARVVVDTDGNKLSITGGQLSYAPKGVVTTGDPGLWLDGVTRTAGRLMVAHYKSSVFGATDFNFDNDQASGSREGLRTGTAGGGLIVDAGAGRAIGAITMSNATDYYIAIIMRSTGSYMYLKGGIYTNWTLIWQTYTENTAILYPSIGNRSSTAVSEFLRVPDDTWLPTPLAYDTFTRSNGALGNSETSGPDSQSTPARAWQSGGSTWAIASNEAVNTPTLGAELLTNGDFSAWTGDDPDGWTVAGEVGADPEVSEVGTGEGHGGVGSGMCNIYTSGNYVDINQTILTVGKWYLGQLTVNTRVGGTLTAYFGATNASGGINSVATYIFSNRTTTTQLFTIGRIGTSDITIDNVTVKELTLNTLFSSVQTATANVVAQVEIDTIFSTGRNCAGLVLNLDNKDTPANFVIAYHDGVNCILLKCVAGTYTSVISAVAAYAAGANLVVVKSGTSYSLYYNNTQVGSTSTISDAGIVSNTLHGLFSTYSGNQLDNFQVFPRGTNNEYQKLSDY